MKLMSIAAALALAVCFGLSSPTAAPAAGPAAPNPLSASERASVAEPVHYRRRHRGFSFTFGPAYYGAYSYRPRYGYYYHRPYRKYRKHHRHYHKHHHYGRPVIRRNHAW
jgi:hypothetical protein